ncbi:MAG: cytochrome b/b6 domain-containing protein [Nitrospiraceae bacterium]|nr:cytochrome b/b6 domain-containing protein [Nitrospiraceae bacterium]MDA8424384.1 cytochrome b/b6 domain-containing protein [Nitrospiraceae bacterium]
MSTRKVMIYSRFERFWHWTQMALIVTLLFTGFGIHGFHRLISIDLADRIHTVSAIGVMVLWLFAISWILTTGVWKQFMPTSQGLWRVVRFYSYGIFKGESHPFRKTYRRKLNPLQAVTYLALKLILFPAIWLSGFAYLTYGLWERFISSGTAYETVALIHTAAAFAIVAFVTIHVYMLTTGHSFVGHVAPMITGFDDVDLSPEEEAYLEADEPGHIR